MTLFSCKDTARLASEALDGNLTLAQRLSLHVHLLMCPSCARFHQHLAVLGDAARLLDDQAAGGDVGQANLSPEARDRLRRALEQSNEERSRHAGLEP
jgi:hypothetical protein